MWDPKPAKAPDEGKEPWTNNVQIWGKWDERIERRGKPNTKRNLRMYTKPLFRMYPDTLITELNQQDMATFRDTMAGKCSRLMNGETPQCRRGNVYDITACPLLTGQPTSCCAGYAPLQIGGLKSYLASVNQMYAWFLEEGRITKNPMLPIFNDFLTDNKAAFEDLTNNPRRRVLTLEEVRTLVLKSPPQHAIAYLLSAKCFLRIHEALLLTFDPRYCNLDEGWMKIPPVPPGWPRKRQGNPDIILDAEAREWLRWYRDTWWTAKVRRETDDKPVTMNVVLSQWGLPRDGENAENNFNKHALHVDAKRLGIMTGKETEREERTNTHCFRAFATTWARGTRVDPTDNCLLRGDKVQGAAGVYDHYRPRLPKLYADHAPVLGIRPP